MPSADVVGYRRVLVWEYPVLLYHWINFACVAVLATTGYLIGTPIALAASGEAYQQYWFGTVRLAHFIAAFVFFFNLLIRLYWGFVGNRYARLRGWLPVGSERWREIGDVLRVDVLQARVERPISLGHNALAAPVYLLVFLASLFQAATGFALYSGMSHSYVPRLFAWVVPLMGGDFAVRQWHHAAMWLFVVFAIVHVYLVFYHDYVEGRGTVSSMASGWKFEREDAPR
ncbi:MAG TPA: Ni/Fe-hydrogenase, b-type cytochrome subunit [Anaeromyxobacteraceae bacterium]|nr:Ni/Fe-hydrogenase, b-type cytochrome subunit [Anaeromyxobacteraceae bacterium]